MLENALISKRTWIRQVILHVKTMQNYHLAQTTHNTKDTDKVHGLLYTGVLFCLHSHPFIAFGYACVLILQTQDFHFRSRATSQFHLITLVDSIQVFLIKELFDVGLFSGRDKRQTWVLDLFEGMLKQKLALLHKKLNYLEIASCACKKKKKEVSFNEAANMSWWIKSRIFIRLMWNLDCTKLANATLLHNRSEK